VNDTHQPSIADLLNNLPSSEDIEREIRRRSFPAFAEYHSEGKWQAFAWIVHAAIEITKKIKEGGWIIIVSTPPQHGKTMSFGQWLSVWFLHNYPDLNVIYSSYSDGKAKEVGAAARDLYRYITSYDKPQKVVKNDELKHKTKEKKKDDNIKQDMFAAGLWATDDGGKMYSTGVGGGITGKGFNLGIVDDPIKDDIEAQSPARREKIRRWFDKVFDSRRRHGSTTILIMTRWHNDDLVSFVKNLKGRKIFEIKFKALAEGEGDPLGRKAGEPLCPELHTKEDLEEKRTSSTAETWASLYQQEPSPAEGSIFKLPWLNYWAADKFEPISIPNDGKFIEKQPIRLPNDYDLILQSWDMSFRKTTDGSFVAGQVWGFKKPNFYLLDQHRKREGFSEAKRAVVAMSDKWTETNGVLIEAKANGDAIESELKDEIPGIVMIEPRGSKEARASAASIVFEAGNVFIQRDDESQFTHSFVNELLEFPRGANDDQVDAATQAVNYIKKKYRRMDYSKMSLPEMTKVSDFGAI